MGRDLLTVQKEGGIGLVYLKVVLVQDRKARKEVECTVFLVERSNSKTEEEAMPTSLVTHPDRSQSNYRTWCWCRLRLFSAKTYTLYLMFSLVSKLRLVLKEVGELQDYQIQPPNVSICPVPSMVEVKGVYRWWRTSCMLLQRSPCPWDFPSPLSPSSVFLCSGAGDVVVKVPFKTSAWCQKHDHFALSEKHKVSRKGEENLADTHAASGTKNLYYPYPGELIFSIVRWQCNCE